VAPRSASDGQLKPTSGGRHRRLDSGERPSLDGRRPGREEDEITLGLDEPMVPALHHAEKDVQIVGGVATIRQYLEAQLIDELHVSY
jgi:hypothetical protein